MTIIYRTEREKYAKHRHKAEKHPDKYMSLIVDGMDQDKTDILHITSKPKCMAGCYTLETHVTGVRAHGRCSMMAVDSGEYSHDSNLVIEVIVRLLHKFKVIYQIITILNTCMHASHLFVRMSCHQCCTFRWIIPAKTTKTSTHSLFGLC